MPGRKDARTSEKLLKVPPQTPFIKHNPWKPQFTQSTYYPVVQQIVLKLGGTDLLIQLKKSVIRLLAMFIISTLNNIT